MKKNKKILIAVIAFIAVAGLLGGVYYFTKPDTESGQKQVELLVTDKAGEETAYEVETDGEYLIDVMEAAKDQGFTYEGTDSEYGLMVDTVNGEEAVFENDGAYWAFYVNGEFCEYGVSEQPAADGDKFEIRYTVNEE